MGRKKTSLFLYDLLGHPVMWGNGRQLSKRALRAFRVVAISGLLPKLWFGEPGGGVYQAGDSCRILPLTFFWRCLLICGQTGPSLAAHLGLALLLVIPSAQSFAARATFLGINLNF